MHKDTKPNKQSLIHDVNSSDFRVVEYEGVFQIQRKQTKIITTGFWWWKKEIEEVNWKCVDKYGGCIYSISLRFGHIDNYDQMIKDFKDLDSALAKIKVMVNGLRYHYC